MMEMIRSWLIGVTCAAILVSLANSLMPAGAVRKIARLTGGLILMLAVLQPLLKLDPGDLSGYMDDYEAAMSQSQAGLEQENDTLLKSIIEEKTEAYILKKADELGLSRRAKVQAKAGEDGIPVPYSVKLTGKRDARLEKIIETDLAIPAARQSWSGKEDG